MSRPTQQVQPLKQARDLSIGPTTRLVVVLLPTVLTACAPNLPPPSTADAGKADTAATISDVATNDTLPTGVVDTSGDALASNDSSDTQALQSDVPDGLGGGDVGGDADAAGGAITTIDSCTTLEKAMGQLQTGWLGFPCEGDWACQVGKECCCGACSFATEYRCFQGKISMIYSDFCLGAAFKCSGDCKVGYFGTKKGCQTCASIKSGVQAGVAAAIANKQTCQTDAECTALQKYGDCILHCPLPVRLDEAVAVSKAVTTTNAEWCPPNLGLFDPCGLHANCKTGVARCVQGACALVEK